MLVLKIRKKIVKIVAICLIILIPSIFIFNFLINKSVKTSNWNVYTGLTVVIDAGHGGIDGGCEGVSGTTERVINLEYAKTLKHYLENFGFNVVMTRNNLDGLYSSLSSNKKKDDMLARKRIIENCSADLVVSIHMNAFPLESCRGAQVFYNPESAISKSLATSIQECFVENLESARKNADKGDYYILKCTNVPSVIVECGFISNIEEEKLLLTEEYRNKLCYQILTGIVRYFSIN